MIVWGAGEEFSLCKANVNIACRNSNKPNVKFAFENHQNLVSPCYADFVGKMSSPQRNL